MRNLWLVLALFIATGCVSSQKYKNLESEHKRLSRELSESNARNSEMSVVITELQNKLGSSSADRQQLQASVDEMRKAMREMSQRRLESEKRVREFRELLRRFEAMIDTGELSVKIEDGRMVVALSSDVLFSSGSAQLSAQGLAAIRKVAPILRSLEERQFQIEGHTDNVPIKTSSYPSNWDLAAARALTVLKTMVQSGMPEERISAASFGETKPVATNSSAEGKQANRRIEIVVVPDLSKLPGFDELQKLSEEENPLDKLPPLPKVEGAAQ